MPFMWAEETKKSSFYCRLPNVRTCRVFPIFAKGMPKIHTHELANQWIPKLYYTRCSISIFTKSILLSWIEVHIKLARNVASVSQSERADLKTQAAAAAAAAAAAVVVCRPSDQVIYWCQNCFILWKVIQHEQLIFPSSLLLLLRKYVYTRISDGSSYRGKRSKIRVTCTVIYKYQDIYSKFDFETPHAAACMHACCYLNISCLLLNSQ